MGGELEGGVLLGARGSGSCAARLQRVQARLSPGASGGFPRFRKKGRGRDSCRFTTGAIRVEDERHVRLPRVGRLRTHERTCSLLRALSRGGRILSATISREADRWFVSFSVMELSAFSATSEASDRTAR